MGQTGAPCRAARARQLDGFLRRLRFHQHGLAMLVKRLSHVGDGNAASCAAAGTPGALQQRDAPAQFGFRHAQRAPGRREAAMVHHLHKVIQVIQVLHAASLIVLFLER
jgi:hypothetical protein